VKIIGICLILSAFIVADELSMFDVVDSENNITQTVDDSNINARLKFSYLAQDHNSNNAVLYANLSDNSKHYFYDIRLIVDEDTFNVHIKDLYYKTNIDERYFFELGRMNSKEGVARGYNPTDYFKGSSSLTLSIDPKERKDNRLGSLLLQGTYIGDNYTIKTLYSPEVSVKKNNILGNRKHFGLNLDKSNAQERVTLYLGYTGLDDWSMSVLLHHNDDGLNMGANISYIQDRTIAYVEASVNKRTNQMTQTLNAFHTPSDLKELFNDTKDYKAELSLGLNYTFENSIVTTIEYIYNGAGLDKKDWNHYFDLMDRKDAYSTSILGRTRGVIANNAQMLSKHTLFAMARKNDALPNLDWVTMAWMNPTDKSALVQIGLNYDYHDILFTADLRSYLGDDKSEYGSMQNHYEALFSVEYFF